MVIRGFDVISDFNSVTLLRESHLLSESEKGPAQLNRKVGSSKRFRLLIFDGDDTLWDTLNLYRLAKAAFVQLLAEQGFLDSTVLKVFDAINISNLRIHGFSRTRFPISMIQAYLGMCAETGRTRNPEIEAKVRAIGDSVFTEAAPSKPFVQPILIKLSQRYKMVLCTKGEPQIQEMRIDQSGVRQYFHRIFVVPRKGEPELKSILAECFVDPSQACSIGNSLRSDINPALRIGMYAVWIPGATWPAEEDDEIISNRLSKITSLGELPHELKILGSRGCD